MSFKKASEGDILTDAECIISRKIRSGGRSIYKITDGEGELEFESGSYFPVGQGLKVSGRIYKDRGFLKINVASLQKADGLYSRILQKIENGVKTKDVPFLASGETMEKLRDGIHACARKLLTAKKTRRFCLLRFHNDADGISGALALTKVIDAYTSQQNSATYSVFDAMRDINTLQGEEHPLAILLDFGCGGESREGLELLKASGAEVMVIDHHPDTGKAEDNADIFLNPWVINNSESASSYTAGYLAVEIARACGEPEAESLAPVACAGDKSTIIEISEKDVERALVMDYMATYAGFKNKLEFYRNALENPDLYSSVLIQAKEALEKITEDVKAGMKKRLDGPVCVYTVDTERVKSREFPGKGKITTRCFELVGKRPAVVLGFWNRGLSFRINDGAVSRGVVADGMIESLKEEMGDFVLGGGGHARAASIRIRGGFVDSVMEKIIEMVKEKEE
ncbi:MAG: DHH family phosphoesterase [Candidatus Micrarchaeia archaeon]